MSNDDTLVVDILSLIIAGVSLVLTLISSVIAGFSLWLMWKINKTTSEFAIKRAAIEDKKSDELNQNVSMIWEEITNKIEEKKSEIFDNSDSVNRENFENKVKLTLPKFKKELINNKITEISNLLNLNAQINEEIVDKIKSFNELEKS